MNPLEEMDLDELSKEWLAAKEAENWAKSKRRDIEDIMYKKIGMEVTEESTITRKTNLFNIKSTNRFNTKIDGDMLQDIAIELGLSDLLGTLFRWQPEINAKEWKGADVSITKPLEKAITRYPGRPSFKIEEINE